MTMRLLTLHSLCARTSLEHARGKLAEYYGATDNTPDDLFAIGTILGPRNKLEIFMGPEWEKHWAPRYRKSMEKYIGPYQQRYLEKHSDQEYSETRCEVCDIDLLIRPSSSAHLSGQAPDELTRYLGSSKLSSTP